MLATFVYPLLLQPLVEYCNQFDSAFDEDRFSFSENPLGGISADLSDVQKSLLPLAGPTKAALLTLSVVFHYLSNRPLLRLVFTVLLHPLLPDTTKAPTVRSQLQVATVDPKTGKDCIRLDAPSHDDDRTTYEFGTSTSNRREPSTRVDQPERSGDESCTFVLAPALAEVLEFRGGDNDLGLLMRTRPNPYRKAFLRCLSLPHELSDVRNLAVCTLDAALGVFNQGGRFRSAILYGSDLRIGRKNDDDVPLDELTMDSDEAYKSIDRGLGRSNGERPETSASSILNTNYVNELTTAICGAVTAAHRFASDDWEIQYDKVAAHSLLLVTQRHPNALSQATRLLENRLQQTSVALAAIPSSGLMPMGGSTSLLPGAPSINEDDYEEQMYDAFLNAVFFDKVHPNEANIPISEGFVRSKDIKGLVPNGGLAVSVSLASDLKEMSSRVIGSLHRKEHSEAGLSETFADIVATRRESGQAFVQLNAFLRLLKERAADFGDTKLAGIVVAEDGTIASFDQYSRCLEVYTNISPNFCKFLVSPPPTPTLQADLIVDLSTDLALYCVCEVSPALAHYFGGDGVESEGITWQSLCLTFHSDYLAFCRPVSPTEAKVIGFCDMERLSAELDPSLPNATTAARRLGLIYTWFDPTPPPLFLFDAEPTYEDCDGDRDILSQVLPWKSRLDLWFENGETVEQAYQIVTRHCFKAKRARGQRVQSFLDPNKESLQSSFW